MLIIKVAYFEIWRKSYAPFSNNLAFRMSHICGSHVRLYIIELHTCRYRYLENRSQFFRKNSYSSRKKGQSLNKFERERILVVWCDYIKPEKNQAKQISKDCGRDREHSFHVHLSILYCSKKYFVRSIKYQLKKFTMLFISHCWENRLWR